MKFNVTQVIDEISKNKKVTLKGIDLEQIEKAIDEGKFDFEPTEITVVFDWSETTRALSYYAQMIESERRKMKLQTFENFPKVLVGRTIYMGDGFRV